ncbi:hypothetical protein MTO96_041634 [Rhipicephalus appendiculatus]
MLAKEGTPRTIVERDAGLDSKLAHLMMRVHHEVFQRVTEAAGVQEAFSVEHRRYTTARRVDTMSEVKQGPRNKRLLISKAVTLAASHLQIRSKIWALVKGGELALNTRMSAAPGVDVWEELSRAYRNSYRRRGSDEYGSRSIQEDGQQNGRRSRQSSRRGDDSRSSEDETSQYRRSYQQRYAEEDDQS